MTDPKADSWNASDGARGLSQNQRRADKLPLGKQTASAQASDRLRILPAVYMRRDTFASGGEAVNRVSPPRTKASFAYRGWKRVR